MIYMEMQALILGVGPSILDWDDDIDIDPPTKKKLKEGIESLRQGLLDEKPVQWLLVDIARFGRKIGLDDPGNEFFGIDDELLRELMDEATRLEALWRQPRLARKLGYNQQWLSKEFK